jgi:hypothetical protein
LTAARTYYVRTDGSDSNTGLANTAGGAFLTVQKAVDVASGLDNGGFDITIQIADGTYTGAVLLKSFAGSGKIIIQGNNATPANVFLNVTGTAIYGTGVLGVYSVRDLKIIGSVFSLYAENNSVIRFQNLDFGAGAFQIFASYGGIIYCDGNYTVSGGAAYHYCAAALGTINMTGRTVTLTGTPAFFGAFAYLSRGSDAELDTMTFVGSATGKRYDVATNGVINTAGGGATYLPGNAAGTSATGGQYV